MQLTEAGRKKASGHCHSIITQEVLDQRRDHSRLFNMQHVSRTRDTDDFDVRNYVPKRGVAAIRAELGQVLRFLAQEHQDGRLHLSPTRFCIFAMVADGVDPTVSRVAQQSDAAVNLFAPCSRHEAGLSVAEAWVTKLNNG